MALPEVGKAYLGRDGLIRWVTYQSTRGYVHLMWYHAETDAWHYGGRVKANQWENGGLSEGGEVPAPVAGDTCRFCGSLGFIRERIDVTEQNAQEAHHEPILAQLGRNSGTRTGAPQNVARTRPRREAAR